MAMKNNPKGLRNMKIIDKITWTNYNEEDFIGVEVTVVEEEDLIGVLGVV